MGVQKIYNDGVFDRRLIRENSQLSKQDESSWALTGRGPGGLRVKKPSLYQTSRKRSKSLKICISMWIKKIWCQSLLSLSLSLSLPPSLSLFLSLSLSLSTITTFRLSYLPTPPLGQDMTQGQIFLSGV